MRKCWKIFYKEEVRRGIIPWENALWGAIGNNDDFHEIEIVNKLFWNYITIRPFNKGQYKIRLYDAETNESIVEVICEDSMRIPIIIKMLWEYEKDAIYPSWREDYE